MLGWGFYFLVIVVDVGCKYFCISLYIKAPISYRLFPMLTGKNYWLPIFFYVMSIFSWPRFILVTTQSLKKCVKLSFHYNMRILLWHAIPACIDNFLGSYLKGFLRIKITLVAHIWVRTRLGFRLFFWLHTGMHRQLQGPKSVSHNLRINDWFWKFLFISYLNLFWSTITL